MIPFFLYENHYERVKRKKNNIPDKFHFFIPQVYSYK